MTGGDKEETTARLADLDDSVSKSYNVAYGIAGGIAPPPVGWLARLAVAGPAHYAALVCVVSTASELFWLRSRRVFPAAAAGL